VVAGSREGAEALMGRFGLLPHASSFVSELSTGMKRILDLAVATAHSPALLILDEPSSGLAAGEVEHLAALIKRWRDASGAGVLVVEHDAALVQAIADEVIVLNDGRVAAQGVAVDVLGARRRGTLRLKHPEDPAFIAALGRVAAGAAPAAPLARRALSTWTLMRLGLRQFAAGMSSVLIMGVLNRVLKVELGVSLTIVAPILASLNLAAPLALGFGHMSDTRPIFGYRRTPYIIGGAVVAGSMVALAPHIAGLLAADGGITAGAVLASLALFIVMGIGMYGAGTVFFALVADIAPEQERAHASSVVYLMLIAGIFAGVLLTAGVLDADAGNLSILFAIVGALVVALTTVAVWGKEERVTSAQQMKVRADAVPFRTALREVGSMRQARTFFIFMLLSTVFLFLQQAVLEPFGGEVLGMDVRATSAFNAMLTLGILIGIVGAGRPWAEQMGPMRIARLGIIVSSIGFGLLAWAAISASTPGSWTTLLVLGIGNGVFTVAGLALMMGMASRSYAALFMGAWTVAHALAEGIATASGGLIYEGLATLTNSIAGGYATVFAIQAVGLALTLPLLARIDPGRFREESAALEQRKQALSDKMS
jgi:BCD family chlorophyll transporter-like MFS transporter